MVEVIDADICVVGGGSGGLSVAAGASQMGARVVLIEAGKMGGDCLNYGCVPSKSLIAAGHHAEAVRRGGAFGIRAGEPEVDPVAVRDHVRGVIAAIAPTDSVERFEGLGVRVIKAHATFTGPDEIAAGDHRIRAKRFVVATGSRAAVPPIPGLDGVSYMTNETIFDLDARPEHLIVIGGGPIGCELAQAHRRLGAAVTILEAFDILPRDDPEAADVVRRRLLAEGISIHEQAKVSSVTGGGGAVRVTIENGDSRREITGSHLLLATGRRSNIESLDLETAGIATAKGHIEVDVRLRTSNRRVYAIGDVAGGPQFTHVAGYHAGIVIKNALFRLPAKVDYAALPWVTFTDPELAQVGLTEAQARERHGKVGVLRWAFHENDRAQAERRTEGFVKAIVAGRGRIVGATVVGAHAGELVQPWVLAIARGMKARHIAEIIAPYPTLGEASKRAAGSYFTPALFSPRTRRIVRFLLKFA